MIYVLWKEKHTGNGDHLIFMRKSFLQSFLMYAELREMAKRKKIVIFHSFFNNIWKHRHYKAVLNLHPILWNNYKKFVTYTKRKWIGKYDWNWSFFGNEGKEFWKSLNEMESSDDENDEAPNVSSPVYTRSTRRQEIQDL